jgi:hypothetical protein
VDSSDARVAENREAIYAAERLASEGTLPEGTHSFPVHFRLPEGSPPTHDLQPAYARYEAKVHVSLPWRRDVRHVEPLRVNLAPPSELTPLPVTVRSEEGSGIELSLPTSALVRGERITGSFAVFDPDDYEPRDVLLTFRSSLALHGPSAISPRVSAVSSFVVTVPRGGAGKSIPFHLTVPPLLPSFSAATHSLSWSLCAETGVRFRRRATVAADLQIVEPESRSPPPEVGVDPRISALFASHAGTRGWRAVEGTGPLLWKETESFRLSVRPERREREGTFLEFRVDHHNLGLGLSVLTNPGSARC